jgi:SAM-dependent methyltransferase
MDNPSDWVVRGAALAAPGARVLDVACGALRHSRHFSEMGFAVVAVDRDPYPAAGLFGPARQKVEYRQCDLETGDWPFAGERFDIIVVTNYLHRPLFPHLIAALNPGGLLIYETFALGNATFGRPSRPDFLLNPGELLDVFAGELRVLAFEHGEICIPKPALVQRLLARRAA